MKPMILMLILIGGLFSCQSADNKPEEKQTAPADRTTLLSKINETTALLKSRKGNKIDTILARDLISSSDDFVRQFPKDPETPKVLYQKAEVVRAMGDIKTAIIAFEKIHQGFPQDEKAPTALFLQAFLLENALNDRASAKKHYLLFQKNYPDHELNQQVGQLLQVIDKSPEEMVREFKAKAPAPKDN